MSVAAENYSVRRKMNESIAYINVTNNTSAGCINQINTTSDQIENWAAEILFPCILFVFATITGTIFNLLLIIAILSARKLRTPPGIMIVVIAISELILCVVFYPVHIVKMLNGETGIPDALCKLSAVLVHVSTFQTITSFPIVAFNRYSYITRQRYIYNEMFNWIRTTIYIVLSWLFPVLIIATPIMFSKPDIRFSAVFRICVISTEIPIYVYIEWLYFLLLYIVTMIIYAKAVLYIRTHVEDRRQTLSVTFVTNGKRMAVQAAKMVALASFGFCVCCLPYLTFRVIDPYLTMLPSLLHRIAYGVMALGSFVNPVLFTLSNTSHLLAIKAIIQLKSPDTYIPKVC